MVDESKPIPQDEWQSVVANVPLVSVDLVVEHDGGVLLGKRENEPAKGEWFVPGGTVLKNEPRIEAVHRVADEELGEPVVVDERLGTYEHFYETSEIGGVDSKHYVATAYRCHFERDGPSIVGDDQHSALDVFRPPFQEFHPYVERYLDEL
ncbi:NUDIX domain-containing protein [Haloarchaeobius sp. HRN-SO-5]|uniref:NUDIX domain-containing protein n=1 Tax=Haloarchaeobius sp. HRN-SO-5 TaxID=3446118 RepID=UPI003EB9BC61